MRATFLGTADGHTSAQRQHSGIFIQTNEGSTLLDCGANVAQYLLQKKISPDLPSAIWISHMHSDHIGQLPSLIQSLWLRARRAPLHFYGEEKTLSALRDWLDRCILFAELLGFSVYWHPVKPGRSYIQGPFVLTPFATKHLNNLGSFFRHQYPQTSFDCFGVNIAYAGERFVYSADLATPRDLTRILAKPTHSLFCELTHFPEVDLFKFLAPHKLKHLWITHYPDSLAKRGRELEQLARRCKFKGEVHLMRDLQSQKIF